MNFVDAKKTLRQLLSEFSDCRGVEDGAGEDAARAAIEKRFDDIIKAGNVIAMMPSYAVHCDSGHDGVTKPRIGCPACEGIQKWVTEVGVHCWQCRRFFLEPCRCTDKAGGRSTKGAPHCPLHCGADVKTHSEETVP